MKKLVILSLVLTIVLSACGRIADLELYGGIRDTKDYQRLFGESTDIRGSYAYINDDDIPELLISEGDYEASRVSVFTISEKKRIEYIGTFGSSCGQIDFIEKSSYIKSSYGNHGSFYQVYSEIGEDVRVIGDLFILQKLDEQPKYYADFCPEGMSDDDFHYLSYVVPDEYEISENEYNKKLELLDSTKKPGWKTIKYEEMTDLDSLIRGEHR